MQLQPYTPELLEGHILLARATEYALLKHYRQVRKGTAIPYASHLLQVAGLVLEYGGTLEQAVAGVLHDAIEDTSATLADIQQRFGPKVAAILEACTDTEESDTPCSCAYDDGGRDACLVHGPSVEKVKAPWRERKMRHLAKLAEVTPEAAVVIACDKLHNLRTQISDLMHAGKTVTFNASYADRRWLQVETFEALRTKLPERLRAELAAAAHEWENLNDLAQTR